MKSFKVLVPATSANIGVGYDCLGLALDLHLELEVSLSDKIEYFENGKPFNMPIEKNYIYTTILYIEKKYNIKIPNYTVNITKNDIPSSRGLGSSASAIVAGIKIANYFLNNKLTENEEVLIATEIEGHPDNVAPTILGGMVVSVYDNNQITYSKIDFPEELTFQLMIPYFKLRTSDSRKVLPSSYEIKDVVNNISKMGMLINSFNKKEFNNIRKSLGDKIHQPYRLKLIENSIDIFQKSKELGAYGEYISGAGPTLISIVDKTNEDFEKSMKKYLTENNMNKWQIINKNIQNKGAFVID